MLRKLEFPLRHLTLFDYIVQRFCPGVLV
jgi:hypothetical protein